MNTASDRRLIPGAAARLLTRPRLWAAAAAIALGACIQGPWDYVPENPPVFKGVTVMAYALAGKPLEHVCFERLVPLNEEATQAFAFYDSADIRVAGRFAGVERTLSLTAIADTPNCFKGDSAALVERGRDYALTATLAWDSAGTKVTTVVRGTAMVPDSFSVHKDAKAPRFAFTGGVPANVLTPAFISILPSDVILIILSENPELTPLLEPYLDTATAPDTLSAELRQYLAKNQKRLQERILALLQDQVSPYKQNDTLFYLNGGLNTLSHYYSTDRSADVHSVLITQQFDPTGSRPETAFDRPLGLEPKDFEYYFPGNHRRLVIYPDAKGKGGRNLLDSLGVVNTWFHTKRNRLFFYGMERPYYEYLSTVTQVQGGGGGDADPRIIPKFNVTGGHGIFVGGIPDSFDVYIKTDSLTKSYPLPEVHGSACNEDGWFSKPDCRDYFRTWCEGKKWLTSECRVDAIMASLEADLKHDDSLKARVASRADTITDTTVIRLAVNEFCAVNAFPDSIPACAAPRAACLETSGLNGCKDALWNYCLDHSWRPPQCGPGLASYCHDRPRTSETLCRHADEWCADPANAGSPHCK